MVAKHDVTRRVHFCEVLQPLRNSFADQQDTRVLQKQQMALLHQHKLQQKRHPQDLLLLQQQHSRNSMLNSKQVKLQAMQRQLEMIHRQQQLQQKTKVATKIEHASLATTENAKHDAPSKIDITKESGADVATDQGHKVASQAAPGAEAENVKAPSTTSAVSTTVHQDTTEGATASSCSSPELPRPVAASQPSPGTANANITDNAKDDDKGGHQSRHPSPKTTAMKTEKEQNAGKEIENKEGKQKEIEIEIKKEEASVAPTTPDGARAKPVMATTPCTNDKDAPEEDVVETAVSISDGVQPDTSIKNGTEETSPVGHRSTRAQQAQEEEKPPNQTRRASKRSISVAAADVSEKGESPSKRVTRRSTSNTSSPSRENTRSSRRR